MLRTIFFDATDTLIYLPRSVGEHYHDVALKFGTDLDADDLNRAFRDAWKEAPPRMAFGRPRPDDDKGWWRALVNRVLEMTLPPDKEAVFPQEPYFETLYHHFAGPGVWAAFPEVHEVLGTLRDRGFDLGVISNFDRRLHAVFNHLRLTRYFRRIIISSEVGADKPDPAIFRYALDAYGAAANETLHVGDDPKRDGGATAIGIAVFELERPTNSLRDLVTFLDEESLHPMAR